MDPIKEAFQCIKHDILELRTEISELKNQINQLKEPQSPPTIPTQNPTQPPLPTDKQTQNPTHNQLLNTPKPQNLPLNSHVSTGNRGVPTDKQTNRQTNQQTDKWHKITNFDDFEKATKVLESLDSIKKEIRLKFKRLTPQEMLVFSTLYSLEEQNIKEITYKLIANNLNLSESSIRDYTNKLINKGVPIIKIRQNNKKITLNISPDLKKIASLSTITKLREL